MTDSWWLKVKRAQKHMVDIRREARRYSERHPYEFIRASQPDHKRSILYNIRMTDSLDPRLSLMLGDFVHNLRSALDHVVVASVPKKFRSNATGFPTVYRDIFAKDANGNFVIDDPDARKDFERSIRGIDLRARAIVILAQPYHLRDEADTWTLGIISRLDNADKHRALTEMTSGVRNIIALASVRNLIDAPVPTQKMTGYYAKEGTVIRWKIPRHGPAPSEVDVNFSATTTVFIKVTGVKGGKETLFDYPLYMTMLSAIQGVRRLLRVLELFVIK